MDGHEWSAASGDGGRRAPLLPSGQRRAALRGCRDAAVGTERVRGQGQCSAGQQQAQRTGGSGAASARVHARVLSALREDRESEEERERE